MLNKQMQNISLTKEPLELKNNLINWLKDYLVNSQKEGYVLGLSGGIDSAVTALLAKDAVDKIGKNLLTLLLPINNDYYDEKTAISICNQYNLKYKIVNMTSAYNVLKTTLNNSVDKPVVYTNLKARLRECTIYFHANNLNYLVLGTINKGEYTIGYFPKNATAGDILPLADLLKNELREIGKSYGLRDEIVTRKASGCVLAKTAEEEWGFTEDELDTMVSHFDGSDESLKSLKEIIPEKKERFLNAYRTSLHKRRFYPIFLKEK